MDRPSAWLHPVVRRGGPASGLIVLLALIWITPATFGLMPAPLPLPASTDPTRLGAPGMLQPHIGSLLVDYYESFLRDQDIEAFRKNVTTRYNEGTLTRVLQAGDTQARRAAVLALGLSGGFGCNASLARALKDVDPTVRSLADNALWAIWFRAGTPENNDTLDRVHTLINRGRLVEAVDLATSLIGKAPDFAEAHNQRAIAWFFQGKFAESRRDCQATLELNPFHVGALSGMGQCELKLGRRDDALKTFRRALAIQPYSQDIRELVAELEAGDR